MKKTFVLVVDDNKAALDTLENSRREAEEWIDSIKDDFEATLKANLLQIAAYVKSYADEYFKTEYSKRMSFAIRYFDTVSLFVRNEKINEKSFYDMYIDFNYIGTRKRTPSRIEVYMKNDEIKIRNWTPDGITDLCSYWKYLKPKCQEVVERAIQEDAKKVKDNLEHVAYQYEKAKAFEL